MNSWIINNPHVIVLTIIKDCSNTNVAVKDEKKSVPKLLLKIYVRDLHNNMVWPVSQGRLSEER